MKTFLSSTYADLVSHRKAAAEAIERLGRQVGRMEVFGARPVEPPKACLAEIDKCDLFVGIYAYRYGHIPDGSHVSITEAEFDYAKANNKPLFCFLIHEDHPWPPRMVEDEPGRSKLLNFKKKVGSDVVRDTFTTCEELAYKVAASLGRYLATINPEPMPRPRPNLSEGHAEFFERILSEVAYLRRELESQKELLIKVNHMSDLLKPSDRNTPAIQPMNEKLPPDLEGCWRDSESASTLYARFLGEDLIIPYCYGGASRLTGAFFDFRRRSENVVFARFKWINSPIQGFAYIERSGSDDISGGWWYAEDVPRQALEGLERGYRYLKGMNDLKLSRLPQPKRLPKWVGAFFSIPKDELLNRLRQTG